MNQNNNVILQPCHVEGRRGKGQHYVSINDH